MDRHIERAQWAAFFKEFTENNQQRPTRLEIIDDSGDQSEEHGLPLLGIDLELKGADAPCVEVLLGDAAADNRRLSHMIPHVDDVRLKVGKDGRDEVLSLESRTNITTLLCLEDLRELAS